MKYLICKKSVPSTLTLMKYFIKGKKYKIIKEDKNIYYVNGEDNREIFIGRIHSDPYYFIDEIFYSVQELRKMKINKLINENKS